MREALTVPDLLILGLLGTNCISDLNSRLIAAASKRVVAVDILVTQPEDRIQWKCGLGEKPDLHPLRRQSAFVRS